jgi:hypothetical protein
MLRETLSKALELPQETQETTSGCLDVETLAAWSDGTLGRRDRAVAEGHAATCARCQAMLAAMAKTAPPVPMRKWWQTSAVRWLVPVASVSALAVVVWMNVPAQRLAVQSPQMSPANSAPAPVSEANRADTAPSKAKDTRAAERPAEPKRTEQRDARADKENAPVAAADKVASLPEQPAASAVVPEGAADQTFRTRIQSPAPAASPPIAAAAAPPPQSASAAQSTLRSVTDRASAENVVIQPPQSPARRSPPALLSVQSPTQDVRWRIVAGTTVERSTDGGTTWLTQSTGAPVRLVAGAAPSPTVCWLVGPGGVVLLSKDGRTWERAAFPEAIDLTTIVATDGSSATVTAADGRNFTTADGGKTWTIVSSR